MGKGNEQEAGSTETESVEAAAATRKPGGIKIMVLLPVLVTCLVVGATMAFFAYEKTATAAETIGLGGDSETEESEEIEYGEFHEIQGMIINPADTGGRRYLMINVGLEAPKTATLEEVKAKEIVIRDMILRRLSKKTVEELSSIEYRPQIKAELLDEVNVIVSGDGVSRLYFTQYVLQ